MNKKSLFIVSLVLSFVFVFSHCSKKNSEPIYCKYADDITKPYLSYILKKYHLSCFGIGGGFLNDVNKITLYLQGENNQFDIEKSRILIVNCTEELLYRINIDEKIRPYLDHYPFTDKGIHIGISFDNQSKEKLSFDYIARVSVMDGTLYYSHYNQNTEKFVDAYEEPYANALKKVKDSGHLQLSESNTT